MFVTDAHLGVALEYAAGGELFDTVARAGKLPEIEARYFFQQLILGLEYCHNRVGSMLVCLVCNRVSLPTVETHDTKLRRPACSVTALDLRCWCVL